jgi:GTP-binding protein
MKRSLPLVVIVGRMNVGKSTLFNRLSTDVKSLAFEYPGVTRDFIQDIVCWQDRCFTLIDTGGISLRKTDDPITEQVRLRALQLLEKSDLLLFVCDGMTGVVQEDREIAAIIHKLEKKTIVIANKSDTAAAQERLYEFDRLGFKGIIPISAQHGKNIAEVLETIIHSIPKIKREEEEPSCRVVILGKPNVGKSSLMNALLKQERTIVAGQPGTTREAISERITFYQEDILVTDTPGLRRQRGIREPLEKLMVKSALHALENSDIVLLLVDASQGMIADQELKLAYYAFEEQYKALVILFNKTDLVEDPYTKKTLDMSIEEYGPLFKKISYMYISCKTGANVGKIIPMVNDLCQRYAQQFNDADINHLFKEALIRRPLYRNEQPLHVYEARQIQTAPITILLLVNEPRWFEKAQLGFFENLLRQNYDLKGIPVRFVVRKK